MVLQVIMSVENQSAGIVIIGAGLAGWHVIDAIRAKDKNIPITLITADNGDRYHKPMLTMAISQQKTLRTWYGRPVAMRQRRQILICLPIHQRYRPC